MIQIKKTILTLVALLAVTTGAWADGVKLTTVELVPTDAWNGNYDELPPSDMPGLTADGITEDQAKAWADVPKSGYVDLIYGYVVHETYIDYKVVQFLDGEFSNSLTKIETYHGVYLDKDIGTTIYYVASAASGTAVEVAWNKATKTGQFTMPGGNVELEPEYYPQAALATGGAPTAINDVPATTDGAIVEAGTVANIGETTTAQGTVMYYVSQTALDDAALLALAADAWTADVPTAESFTAAGTAYVYYYVRGNEGDTDETTFSDGDILATNKLTVTIAAAPTYAVTFAEGTDPNEWTASPAADVKKGQTVTVTYSGSKKVLGVKAEKKAKAPTLDNTTTAWADGSTYAVPAGGLTYSAAITVSGDVTLVLTDGETLTLNKGISLAEGATLTVEGEGTMNVNGTNGNTSSTVAGSGTLLLTSGTLNATGGNGADAVGTGSGITANAGGVAINGAVTVSGGTLTATGGNGGSITGQYRMNCKGGAGGAAISGALTINGGTVTTTNGTNGSVGSGCFDCTAGAGGAAAAGGVTDNR